MNCKNCGEYIEDKNCNYCPYCKCQLNSGVKVKDRIGIIILTCITIVIIFRMVKTNDPDPAYILLYCINWIILLCGKLRYYKSIFIKIYFWIWSIPLIIVIFVYLSNLLSIILKLLSLSFLS